MLNAVVSAGFAAVTSGEGSVFSNKTNITNFVHSIGKTFKGNHPAVKSAANNLVGKTCKAIFKEGVQEIGETAATQTSGYWVEIYGGMYTGSKQTRKKLRGYTY